jgi:hypothetical protein
VSVKLLGTALLTVLPVRERRNNYRCSVGSEWRGDRRYPGGDSLRGNQYGFTLGWLIHSPQTFRSQEPLVFHIEFRKLAESQHKLRAEASKEDISAKPGVPGTPRVGGIPLFVPTDRGIPEVVIPGNHSFPFGGEIGWYNQLEVYLTYRIGGI